MSVVEERNGYRVRLVQDECPSEPYNDGGTPVLSIDSTNWYSAGRVEFTGYGHDLIDGERALQAFVSYFGMSLGVETFERWVRIFHDGDVKTWHSGNALYVAYTSRSHFEEWGCERAEADLAEWQSYVEGDVYGVVVERRERAVTTYPDNEDMEDTESVEWVHEDSCWGHYGHDWALEAARDALNDYAPEVQAA